MARFGAYIAHPDPMTAVANLLGVILASNQPFYPLYFYAVVGDSAWPAWVALISAPFFAAVPALSRVHSGAGRAGLVLIGVFNTAVVTLAMGAPSATQLFFFPCLFLAVMLFRPSERLWSALLLALTAATYFVLSGAVAQAFVTFSSDQYRAIAGINTMSAATLSAFAAYLISQRLGQGSIPADLDGSPK
jgi:hypothetical protein